MTSQSGQSHKTVIGLLCFWIILLLALVYLYKKINADTNGQYTIQLLVFGPGGLRDRLRLGVGLVENRFGVRIWPEPRDDEENIGNSAEDDKEEDGHDKQNDGYTEEREQQENDNNKDDSSSDYSSIDLRERAKMQKDEKKSEKNEAEGEKKKPKEEEEEEEAAAEEQGKNEEVKNEEKVGLLVDLKPFTGGAIWSEESGNDGHDLTSL